MHDPAYHIPLLMRALCTAEMSGTVSVEAACHCSIKSILLPLHQLLGHHMALSLWLCRGLACYASHPIAAQSATCCARPSCRCFKCVCLFCMAPLLLLHSRLPCFARCPSGCCISVHLLSVTLLHGTFAVATQTLALLCKMPVWVLYKCPPAVRDAGVGAAQGYGRLGGLGEVDARALWSRQNMPADTFQQVWALSDLDSNQLLSKPEFCLFMYLMHALRNFQGSFHLPEAITPEQATRILGLEGVVGAGARGMLQCGVCMLRCGKVQGLLDFTFSRNNMRNFHEPPHACL